MKGKIEKLSMEVEELKKQVLQIASTKEETKFKPNLKAKVWIDTIQAVSSAENCETTKVAVAWADRALEAFEHRFNNHHFDN